ncbi:MAG: DNA mismatch repair endonuclease MutL [Myxococcota bacterium]
MNRIIRLDKETISKISAGEVIIRPSNAVKELIENSIDAGADYIEIEIIKGGKELIRVTDNGCGIERDDLPLTIERFATSKIKKIEDLNNTYTMGFRGEALASIAAVARLSIVSSTGTEAYLMEVENSEIKSIKETAAPKGTTVTIKDLFYNLPVRKKFLKTDSTEMLSITDTFIRYVIAHPKIHFKLLSSKRILQEYFSQKDFLTRILSVFREYSEENIREFDAIGNYISLKFIGSTHSLSIPDQRGIYTYVNNRFVNDRLLKRAIIEAYSNILPTMRYPVAVLFLRIDPKEIDVNVHPQKTEIRFRDTNRVYSEVLNILKDNIKTQSFNINIPSTMPVTANSLLKISESSNNFTNYNSTQRSEKRYFNTETQTQNIFVESGYFSSLRIIGQFKDRFIILEGKDSLILIDQHAAQERILYNNIINGVHNKGSITQRMLIPLTIELNPSQIMRVRIFMEQLIHIGFEIEIFQENTAIVKGIPVALTTDFNEEIFINIVNSLNEDFTRLNNEMILSEIAATTACHASVRGKKTLSEIEIKRLLIDMDRTDFSIACPHGRPVYFEITIDEIEKRFERK